MQPPTGTVTFLFTDIEGSSRLWERFPVDMGPALARHDEILRNQIEARGGYVFKTVGDAFCAAFSSAEAGFSAAVGAQNELFAQDWGRVGPLRVRMGLHTGTAEFRDNDYFGGTLNRVARISSAGHGGQILCSQVLADLVRGDHPETGFFPLGDFRLRNLNQIERIFQINAPGLPTSFPPLRSQQNLPHNLPLPQTSFVGRVQDLEQVKSLLGRSRVLTLLGTGGTGKTRLALEAGRELLENYPDGVWLVELASMEEDSMLLDPIAAVLGVREEPGRSLGESVASFLCQRKLLLILDNCEHLPQAVLRDVAPLVSSCRSVNILATSRQALHLPGEVTYPVRPLAAFNVWGRSRDRGVTVADIEDYESVRLFVDRAQAVVPTFRLSEDNAADVARICWRLDGIPLALELAAARLRVLTPAQIAERLSDQFRLLKGNAVLPHQQTLRALIDWSYDLLSAPEKRLFHRLGVFAGGRTIDAVEEVCMEGIEEDGLDLLQQLADKSLIFVEQDPALGARYTLLESVWQYAREKLAESGEMQALQDRHLQYYLGIVESAVPHLRGRDPAPFLKRLSADLLNLRYAMEWAAERPADPQPGLRFVSAMERYWEICGNLQEARRHCEAVLGRHDAGEHPALYARALTSAGRVSWAQDLYTEGRASLTRAIEIFERLGDEEMLGFASGYLGFLIFSEGDRVSAAECFARTREIAARLGVAKMQALAIAGEGSLVAAAGRLEEAFAMKREALKRFRETGDKWIVGYSLWGVALAALALKRPADARPALEEWAGIAREVGNRWAIPYIIQHLADAARLEGKPELAARLLGFAEYQRKRFGLRFSHAEQATYEELLAGLRQMLSAEAFETLWKAGAHLRPEAALDLALAGRE